MEKYLTFVKEFFSSRLFVICLLLCSCLLLSPENASAQMTSSNVFSDILQRYQSVASAWSTNHNETCKLAFLVSRFDQYDLDIRADGAKES